jgi:hypothetical protein
MPFHPFGIFSWDTHPNTAGVRNAPPLAYFKLALAE